MSERPIRIVYILTRMSIGSPAMHTVLLTQRFSQPPYESFLICGESDSRSGDMRYFADLQGIQPIYIPLLGGSLNPVSSLLVLLRLYRLIRRLEPDIVHTHLAQAGFTGRIAAWLAGVPVIVHTVHAHVFGGQYDPISTWLFIALERFAASRSDTIITLTQSLRYELVERYRIARYGRITILPLGLDLNALAQTPRKMGAFRREWSIPPDAPLIGIVGQLSVVKNHALFLQAAALIRAQVPDARFVIVGDGELRHDLEAQTRALNLHDAVIFTGWLRDLPLLYSDLDVLVNSSISEGTPTPIIEALTAGCPVVATAVGGVPDLLDHGRLGRLALPNNADSLAQSILAALTQPLENAARDIMLKRYGIDRLVSDLDSLYQGLLAKHSRQRK